MGFRELARSHNELSENTSRVVDAVTRLSVNQQTLRADQEETADRLAAFVNQGFMARLRWLVIGRWEKEGTWRLISRR